MAKPECNIIAVFYIGRGRIISTPLTRRYSSLDNALAGTVRWMRRDGFVGDKIVVHHRLTGMELGVVKMTTAREVNSKWYHEKEWS